ncbi:MAG: CPBP family intramembrane metalloprotease [Acidobacteria bacterium]|nr:CPBP family intramembrane metalloprotease [Acidobacteriota bacterium]
MNSLKPPLEGSPWVIALLGMGVAPLAEELLFRAVILRGLWMRYSARTAIPVSAALFGGVHGPTKMAGRFGCGLWLGWLYARQRSLWPPVIAHALNNAALLLQFILPAPGGLHWTTGLAFMAAGACWVWAAYRGLGSPGLVLEDEDPRLAADGDVEVPIAIEVADRDLHAGTGAGAEVKHVSHPL